ncbi:MULTISPECIES: polysaccharide deacetylase family protein [Streptomycetaceae]|uniref:Putative polysaccharide deacetylase, putative secreted protein n=1 Tax=Streptantibioticus cattleyicolor (strain ATCC 35852 / DSM 46488 / JCM 4925 / NBRC 14057 / NRRL 8057) TaxID=1003195 RepID=F8K467_STREN|nr:MULTISPECIES: polysaccharide deacetylase family protein [Streptomycetaceae]AEW92612.1 putative polysaccharide deacetylase, putative secreted protein [Streptantibioticus cattleyicolor NRRL 8057 = DSM 46488]MYS57392.1 polysaccharide deacetylase family protein [Streptomyces sp. SID5468]CCB72966.1 putative polysaccharide deacetylase; secreted protein [Streptantibioticus cattleyicolor NRRL 8057 = DSM 46488]
MRGRMAPGRRTALAVMAGGLLAGCAGTGRTATASPAAVPATRTPPPTPSPSASASAPALPTRAGIVARYGRMHPVTWGFDAPGVVSRLPSAASGALALTFDACGGPGGAGYDARLIGILRHHQVPATLFINSRWIDANPEVFRSLAADPLFEIGNHGTRHRPLSVTGRSAYHIPGTRNAGEVYDEVAGNHVKLTKLLGRPPRFFRSGTAYCDDVAARIVVALGERFVNFSVNGDGGATFTPAQVDRTVAAAPAGSIVISHMNHPHGGTAEGYARALPRLLGAGHRFVRLSDVLR